jgi:predicted RNase H-like HicB family nuclease
VTIYIALLRKDLDSDYGVDFPDFPGCITAGSTLEETRAMAAEALEFHIDGMLEAVRVDVPLSPAPAEALDALARKLGKSRSAVLTEAVRRMIAADKEHHAA